MKRKQSVKENEMKISKAEIARTGREMLTEVIKVVDNLCGEKFVDAIYSDIRKGRKVKVAGDN